MTAQRILRHVVNDERSDTIEFLQRFDRFPQPGLPQQFNVELIVALEDALQSPLHPLGGFRRIRNRRHDLGKFRDGGNSHFIPVEVILL
jgi:hypothetical protein